MAADPSRRREFAAVSSRDRLLAWLVTGPLGRLYGIVAELTVALWRAATRQPQRED